MTNPTPHGQVPEALIDLIDTYAETRHRCGGIYNAKTEAARKAVIEALSGVQALSAAPAGWRLVPVEPTNGMQIAADTWIAKGFNWPKAIYRAMLAASPTPPAEQAAPKAAPGVGNSGFDHQTAADFLNGKTISDEAVRKFVQASRWAHDEKAYLSAMLLSVRGDLASREAEIALLKKALLKAEAAPQQKPSQDTLYLLRRLLSNQHTLTGPEFRAELEKIVGEAYQQEAQGLMPADAELLAHIKEAVPGLTRVNTALMVAKAVLEKFGSRRMASEVK